ncbi:hypothetical protein AAMO2058_001748400 [Amorphochlora amoebiformis]
MVCIRWPGLLLHVLLRICLAREGDMNRPRVWRARVIAKVPHDQTRFTEGLALDPETDMILESTGIRRQSCLFYDPVPTVSRRTGPPRLLSTAANATRARVVRRRGQSGAGQRCIANNQFAEGVAISGDKVYQLTYKAREMHIYTRKDLKPNGTAHFPEGGPREGWGLAAGEDVLYISDGSDRIQIWSTDLEPLGTISASEASATDPARTAVSNTARGIRLNELEYIPGGLKGLRGFERVKGREKKETGILLANLLMSDRCIVAISPKSGRVEGYILLPELWRENPNRVLNMLNGIAFDQSSGMLLITGKSWPHMYWIDIEGESGMKDASSICFQNYVQSLIHYPSPTIFSHIPSVSSTTFWPYSTDSIRDPFGALSRRIDDIYSYSFRSTDLADGGTKNEPEAYSPEWVKSLFD